MRAFLDTSAFAKRYLRESGSDEVLALCEKADEIGVSILCAVELVSALRRLLRERKLSARDYAAIKQHALADLADLDICDFTPSIIAVAIESLERGPLRSLDALQVACAVAYRPELFVSADNRQVTAARRAGLKTIQV